MFAIRLLAVNKAIQKNRRSAVTFSDFAVWQLQPAFRRDTGVIDIHLKVQVVAGAVAGAAHRCDCLTLGHGLTGRNAQGGAVRVESVDLIAVHNAMVDLDVLPQLL